jgi:hypothetical protein
MSQDREQKIRDVYEAIHREHMKDFREVASSAIDRMHRQARAVVDGLDPIKRIELSGGFHAEPAPADSKRYNVFDKPGPHTTRLIGNLSKEAAEAWAEAAISHQKLNQRQSA